ncbi:MAG: Calx-beta domain-containing protein, partial [Bacteroidota bacterium]
MRKLALVGFCLLGLAVWQACDPEEIFEATVTVSATQSPGSEGGQDGEFTVQFSLTNSTDATITVPYTVGGTATPGEDYTTLPGSLTIGPGENSATLAIDITDDEAVEETETVVITLNDTGLPEGITLVESALSDTVIIEDNDFEGFSDAVSVSIFPDSTHEGEQINLSFILDGGNTTGTGLPIPFQLSGTATQGQDYTLENDSIVIADGERIGSATITITDDTEIEDTETIIITIDSLKLPDGLKVGDTPSVTIPVGDNDEAETIIPAVSVVANTATGTEGGTHPVFTFSLDTTNITQAALTIPYTVGGSATSGEDYTALSGSIAIAVGQSSAILEVILTDDDEVEEEETILLSLDTENLGEGLQAGDPTTATATIQDNDEEPEAVTYSVVVSATADTASEAGTAGEFTFTLDTTNVSGGGHYYGVSDCLRFLIIVLDS